MLNFLVTYWFIRLVLPTPLSPRMMTLSGTLRLYDMTAVGVDAGNEKRRLFVKAEVESLRQQAGVVVGAQLERS